MRDTCLLIDAQLINTPSIESIAQELRVTTRTLQRSFISVLGISPKQYLLASKLNVARQKFRGGEHKTTVVDIAHEFGFSSSCRFIEHYHRHFGHIPSTVLRLNMQ